MMQPETFTAAGYMARHSFADEIDGGGGFFGYRLSDDFSFDMPPAPPGILDSYCGSDSSSSFELRRRFDVSSSDVTETMPDEKTLAALRNHKEAEKRRRERINSHLDRLRSILPCSSKLIWGFLGKLKFFLIWKQTDKATLLAKVVQRVRDLNQEASGIMKMTGGGGGGILIPSERDEFSVHADENAIGDKSSGELILRASLCCEDRSDLFSELTQVVNSLNLKTVRAEMSTLGGRTRNVLIVSGDRCRGEEYVAFLHDALKGIVQRSGSADRLKRRRRMEPQLS
ncbi:hypothetical protein V2J09_024000 [Rumex salicifolius]